MFYSWPFDANEATRNCWFAARKSFVPLIGNGSFTSKCIEEKLNGHPFVVIALQFWSNECYLTKTVLASQPALRFSLLRSMNENQYSENLREFFIYRITHFSTLNPYACCRRSNSITSNHNRTFARFSFSFFEFSVSLQLVFFCLYIFSTIIIFITVSSKNAALYTCRLVIAKRAHSNNNQQLQKWCWL